MKWVNHQIITSGVVWLGTGNIFAVIFAWKGSVFPDLIEGRPPVHDNFAYNNWRKKHRKFSHWFVSYLFLIFAALLSWDILVGPITLLPDENPLVDLDFLRLSIFGAFFFLCGVMLHILQDSITGTVPGFNWKKRDLGARLIKVGSVQEYLISGSILCVLMYVVLAKPEKYLVSFVELLSVVGWGV